MGPETIVAWLRRMQSLPGGEPGLFLTSRQDPEGNKDGDDETDETFAEDATGGDGIECVILYAQLGKQHAEHDRTDKERQAHECPDDEPHAEAHVVREKAPARRRAVFLCRFHMASGNRVDQCVADADTSADEECLDGVGRQRFATREDERHACPGLGDRSGQNLAIERHREDE